MRRKNSIYRPRLDSQSKINKPGEEKSKKIHTRERKNFSCNSRSFDVNEKRLDDNRASFSRGRGPNITIEDCRRAAEERKGKCLSEEYKGLKYPLKWQCDHGHLWISNFHNIKYSKTWCPSCFKNKTRHRLTFSFEKVKTICLSKGFEIISKEYKNSLEQIEVKHIPCQTSFKTTFHNITHKKVCPECSLRKRADIIEAENLVKVKEGKIIGFAKKSKNNSTWECAKGHQWRTTWSNIKKGSWCPFCAGKKSISSIHKQAVAKLYQHKRWDAEKGYQTTIELEDIVNALKSKCVYCDNNATNVDRKNSNLGHLKENCVPCCGRCNRVKNNCISYETMLKIGKILKEEEQNEDNKSGGAGL
jgi:hypothetical protein